jgi:hypothetical protein
MTTRSKLVLAVATALVAVIAGSIGQAYARPTATIHACYDKASGKLRFTDPATNVPKGCTSKEAAVEWSELGLAGPEGPQGAQGPAGEQGPPGLSDQSAKPFLGGFDATVTTGTALAAQGASCTIGRVRLTAGRLTAGGVPADGRLLDITENEDLYSLLGTQYGGDGETTFALPDLRPITPNGLTYSVCVFGVFPQH